ncbi:hypothetical protein D3C72_1864380 [compost metagenome]
MNYKIHISEFLEKIDYDLYDDKAFRNDRGHESFGLLEYWVVMRNFQGSLRKERYIVLAIIVERRQSISGSLKRISSLYFHAFTPKKATNPRSGN